MSEEQPRAAGVRREDRLAAGADTQALVKRTKSQEIDSSHRVYTMEWLHSLRAPSQEQATQRLEAQYAGRVRPEHLKVVEDFDHTWVGKVKLWNVRGEWKTQDLAARHAASLVADGWPEEEVKHVARNARAEHVLRQYGVLMLPQETKAKP